MQRDRAMLHKCKISQLKRLAIWEWHARTFKVITIAAIRQAIYKYHFLLCPAKFHLNPFTASPSMNENCNFGQMLTFGAPVPRPYYWWGPNLVCLSRSVAYAYTTHFIFIGLFCCPLAAKNSKYCRFGTSAFCSVTSWWRCKKVECWCTNKNLPLSSGRSIKIVSLLHLQGKIVCTNSIIHKHDVTSVTDTDMRKGHTTKKVKRFWPPWCWMKSKPHQTWHGDKGPWACSCTSKTFGVWHTVSLLGSAENSGEPIPLNFKPYYLCNPLSKSIQILTANASWKEAQTL